ncbi:hypothetical protein [Terriglobus aquaticus]|uniref:Uncharacterized protein n=1 Tax=Terriglobus aquaticus TaxID=940139 RepID=A0ABW9KEW8_9BACT|nr:hypothetical protein [Terriglobus aquaticus]
MKQQEGQQTEAIANSLRRRAQNLRRQALWMQQAFMDGRGRRITADVVHEILALKEESIELDQLAFHYEKSCRSTARS